MKGVSYWHRVSSKVSSAFQTPLAATALGNRPAESSDALHPTAAPEGQRVFAAPLAPARQLVSYPVRLEIEAERLQGFVVVLEAVRFS